MTSNHGTARLRGLAAELTELRGKANLNTRDAAQRVGLSPATLNRIEKGTRPVSREEVGALLAVYKVPTLERERIQNMARKVDQDGWWEINGAPLPAELPALITFESEATRLVEVGMLLIPGLLQTPDYIREVMASGGVPEENADARVSARLGRQAVLNKNMAPHYTAIIDEAALRRPVGGAEAMSMQLRQLIAAQRRPNVEVRVVPFDRGMDGPYVLMQFPKARDIVHLEHKRGAAFVDEPDDVAPFHEATDKLLSISLGPAESACFLAEIATEYDQE